MSEILTFENVSKVYEGVEGQTRKALDDVSLGIPQGRKVAIVGRSGSGKSTLLHLAAGIDVPSDGRVAIRGRGLSQMSERERTQLRREEVGLVFQFFYLMPHLSVRENVALPALIAGRMGRDTETRIRDLLDRVGLSDRLSDPVQHLSGGEMQRVAICRALLLRPRLLLADEPTGNLDDANGERVMALMMSLVAEEGTALLYVTHSGDFAELADEALELHSGKLAG